MHRYVTDFVRTCRRTRGAIPCSSCFADVAPRHCIHGTLPSSLETPCACTIANTYFHKQPFIKSQVARSDIQGSLFFYHDEPHWDDEEDDLFDGDEINPEESSNPETSDDSTGSNHIV